MVVILELKLADLEGVVVLEEEELGEEIELAQVAINVERKVTLVAIVLKEAKVVEVEVALEHAINVVKKAI